MTDRDARFDRLVQGLRSADPLVLAEFMQEYGPALERVAARRIAPGLQRRVGPETIAQSACRTFLRRAEGGEFEMADGDGLWGLLCAIALTKVREKIRFHRREKRSVDRERSRGEGDADDDAIAPGSPPDEISAFADQFAHVVASLTEEERTIIDLRLRGWRQADVAAELGVTERTVRRLMAGLEERLATRLGGD